MWIRWIRIRIWNTGSSPSGLVDSLNQATDMDLGFWLDPNPDPVPVPGLQVAKIMKCTKKISNFFYLPTLHISSESFMEGVKTL